MTTCETQPDGFWCPRPVPGVLGVSPPLDAGDTNGLAKWVSPDNIQETNFHALELGDHSYPPHEKGQDQINHILCACTHAFTLTHTHTHTHAHTIYKANRKQSLEGGWEELQTLPLPSPTPPQIVFHLIINSDSNPCLESNFFF